jgi:lipopolysaccharide/colanic/teichoic acid biosynthesis glycosyltransferase
MTSLAGAVQAVETGELLESLRARTAQRLSAEFNSQEVAAAVAEPKPKTGPVHETKFFHLACPPVAHAAGGRFYLFAKRVTDIVGSLAALLILSPVILVVAVLTKLSDGGPVFYPHTRVGKWGREFKCFKFRTMVVDAEHIKAEMAHLNTHDDHRTFKVPDDPRVTRIGRWLRRASIDEVPQLYNVLRGDMSLVGPRPPVPSEVEFYDLDDMQRLMVKPGLTCIWQVSGRSRLPFPKQLELDLIYIEQRSYLLDMKLMLKTLPAVFSADGAY